MNPVYQIDSCVLIAFFADEPGADKVSELFGTAERGECSLFMSKVNLLEIYAATWRKISQSSANDVLQRILNSPIVIVDQVSDEVFQEAARLKATHRISLADSIALAEAKTRGAQLLTCDHHEFDAVEKVEQVSFCWIR